MSIDRLNVPFTRRAALAGALALGASAAGALAGCSGQEGVSGSAAGSAAGSADGTKTLRVAMELAYPPFEGKDDAGNPSGVSVTFMEDFAAATATTSRSRT